MENNERTHHKIDKLDHSTTRNRAGRGRQRGEVPARAGRGLAWLPPGVPGGAAPNAWACIASVARRQPTAAANGAISRCGGAARRAGGRAARASFCCDRSQTSTQLRAVVQPHTRSESVYTSGSSQCRIAHSPAVACVVRLGEPDEGGGGDHDARHNAREDEQAGRCAAPSPSSCCGSAGPSPKPRAKCCGQNTTTSNMPDRAQPSPAVRLRFDANESGAAHRRMLQTGDVDSGRADAILRCAASNLRARAPTRHSRRSRHILHQPSQVVLPPPQF